MDASMWIAKTGLDSQQMRMSVISNNLANVNTTGYKRDRATFEDMLYQAIRLPGAQTQGEGAAPTGLMLGTGVRIVSTEKNYQQGSIITTKAPLDVAIAGDGFFPIQQSDGTTAYTRDGSFKLSSNGQIVTASGDLLLPSLVVPPNATTLTIGQDGSVSVELPAGQGAQALGQLQVARFVNPSGLQSIGQNLLRETGASGPPQLLNPGQGGAGRTLQGSLEASNVNVVEEMVNMIETQRAYEINSKAVSAVDGMLRFLNNNL